MDLLLQLQDLLDLGRDGVQLLEDGLDLVPVLRAAGLSQCQADDVVRRHLRQESLGGGHTDLRAGVGVEHRIGLTRDLGTVGVAHRQDAGTLGLGVADGLQGVGGLPGLGDGDDQGLPVQHRVAVAELAGDLDLHRDTHPVLDGVLRQQAGVVGRTAGDDEDLLDLAQVVVRQALLVEDDAAVDEVPGQGVADRGGLLEDLLHHEGVEAALLRGLQVPVDGEGSTFGGGAVEVHDLVAVLGDDHDVVLAEFDGLAGVRDEGGDVGAEEHLVLTDADDQWGGATSGDDRAGLVDMGEQQGEGTLQATQDGHGGGLEVSGGGPTVVREGHQVRGDLGVGLAGQLDTGGLDLGAQRGEVLDDAVVDDGHLAVVGDVRVGVDVVGAPVGRPAGVSDAGRTGEPVPTVGIQGIQQVRQLAGLLLHVQPVGTDDCDTGGVITPVLHTGKGVQTDAESTGAT